MANDATAIDITGVAKTYGRRTRALRGIDLRVHPGEVFGLLGPNGAGKSTLVKILMRVIRHSAGAGSVLGAPIGDRETMARIGYLPEHHRFPDYLTGEQVLDFGGAMSGVPRVDRRRRSGEVMELLGMGGWSRTRVGKYSKGMRQRTGVAFALMADPDLVLLDEPTDGVDPVGRRDIRDVVRALRDRGKTVFINSHLLSELEVVCDRVAILVQGLVSSQGSLDELTAGQERYEFEVRPPEGDGWADRSLGDLLGDATERVLGAAAGHGSEIDGWTLRVRTTDAGAVQPVLDALRSVGAVVRSARPVKPSLEDLFMQAVRDPETGEVLEPGAADTRKPGKRKGAR